MPRFVNLQGFWAATGFLTRLPIPETPYNDQTVRASLPWYPAVGLLMGLLVAGSAWLWQWLFPQWPLLMGVMTVAGWVALTGALHLDGLADTLDAWVGGLGDRERTLAIMKDPHVGSTAVVWLNLFLIAKVAAVAALASASVNLGGLALACVWARLTPLWLFLLTPYVRAQGLGSAMQDAVRLPLCATLTIGVTVLTAVALPLTAVIALMVVIPLLFALSRQWLLHRLGGTTGDTAGALIEITELVFLLTLLAAL